MRGMKSIKAGRWVRNCTAFLHRALFQPPKMPYTGNPSRLPGTKCKRGWTRFWSCDTTHNSYLLYDSVCRGYARAVWRYQTDIAANPSEDDFRRVQENLIGHLVTQKRLKLPPTLFIATLEEELEVISVCNLSGEVCKETLGTRKRTHLASNLAEFLNQLKPLL